MILTRDMVNGDFGIRETSVGVNRDAGVKINMKDIIACPAQERSSSSAGAAVLSPSVGGGPSPTTTNLFQPTTENPTMAPTHLPTTAKPTKATKDKKN